MINHDPRERPPQLPASQPGGHAARSKLAVAAFVLALIPCCPMVSAVGCMLGIVAYRQIRAARGLVRGDKLAKAAIFCGLAVSFLSLLAFTYVQQTVYHGLRAGIAQCIEQFMNAAQQGDANAGGSLWVMSTNPPSADAIAQLGSATQSRYGRFQRFTITAFTPNATHSSQQEVAGVFVFDQKQLIGSARLAIPPQWNMFQPELLLMELKIEDPDAGDLRLP